MLFKSTKSLRPERRATCGGIGDEQFGGFFAADANRASPSVSIVFKLESSFCPSETESFAYAASARRVLSSKTGTRAVVGGEKTLLEPAVQETLVAFGYTSLFSHHAKREGLTYKPHLEPHTCNSRNIFKHLSFEQLHLKIRRG